MAEAFAAFSSTPFARPKSEIYAPKQDNEYSRLFRATINYTKRITALFLLFLLIVACISVNLRVTQNPFGPCQVYIAANKVETFLCFTLVRNEFNVYLILTTELQIFHLSHPVSTKDALESADPNNMQDACHI